MSKFADLYLQVVRRSTLHDSISVTDLPLGIQRELQENIARDNHKVVVMLRDRRTATSKLLALKKQLAAKNGVTNG